MAAPFALVVDQGFARHSDIGQVLADAGFRHLFTSMDSVFHEASHRQPDIVIMTASQPNPTAELGCLQRLRAAFSTPRYVFLTEESSEDLAISAFHAGVERYLKEPWTLEMLRSALMALSPHETMPPSTPGGLVGGESLVGRSQAICQLRQQLARIAPANSNVLVTGETGTGKEVVAELIHWNGPRSSKPFICLNTAAIPDALVESELFGHERGAFTGATTSTPGKLAAANGGTVFLDEIGDVSLPIQAKLLRAIEGKPLYRLGGTRSVKLDARIVAATNQDLERATVEGKFRRDLYYRLNVIRVQLPPLRDRVEDIPPLVSHYLRHFNRELGRQIRGLSPRAMDTLCAYHWPGNIRELRNIIEALLVNLAPETTGIVDVPPEVMLQLAFALGAPTSERERLLQALTETNWNKKKAADQLHCSRMTIYRKMRLHKLSLHPE